MSAMFRDLGYAVRRLRKNPGFAMVVILTLAVSIGANTAIFSLLDAMVLRPLPYPRPERLGGLMMKRISGQANQPVRIDGETWRQIESNVSTVDAATFSATGGVNLEADNQAQYVHGQRVSARYFDVLGIRPLLGRSFTEAEDTKGGPRAVILSYGLWQKSFHGDTNLLGQAIRLKSVPYTVIGILPENARTPSAAELWTSLRPSTSDEGGGDNYSVIVRLKDRAGWQEANAQLSRLQSVTFRVLEKQRPGEHFSLCAVPLQEGLTAGTRTPVSILMAAVGFILLIACANLAGLALVRIGRKEAEIATRLALGVTRWAILRQFWLESLVLAVLGGGAALLVGSVSLELLTTRIPNVFLAPGGVSLDFRVLLFTAAVTISASVLFGLLPATRMRRVDVRTSMANRGSHAGSARLRYGLITGEVALTIVLLTTAGLLIRTLIYLETLPPGFNSVNVMTAKASLDDARYNMQAPFLRLLDRSVAAMRAIPGVEAAAVGLNVPYERALNYGVQIADGAQTGQWHMTDLIYVTPGYFTALQIPLQAGRPFLDSDTPSSQFVAIVNASFARDYLGRGNAVGRHLRSDGNTIEVVGVVGDVVVSPGFSAGPMTSEPAFYVPATQMPTQLVNLSHVWFQPSWIVRTKGPVRGGAVGGGPVAGATRQMQQALASADPDLPISGFYSMKDILADVLLLRRVEAGLLTTLAGLALMLSAIGIYGLVSSLVNQRTRELGIRMALGCTVRGAMLEASRGGFGATGTGVMAGLLLSWSAARVVRSQLFGIRAYDPLTMAGVTALLVLVAAVAAILPTFRITRIDPAQTLRSE